MTTPEKIDWKPVIVESPFKGNHVYTEAQNRAYLEACLRDCIDRGETPYASHKMLTDCLDDSIEEEREKGIQAGLAMAEALRSIGAVPKFYLDLGWSDGMLKAQRFYEKHGIEFKYRKLPSRTLMAFFASHGTTSDGE